MSDEVVRMEADIGDLTDEQRKALEALGYDVEDDEPGASESFQSLDELLAYEQREDEGFWVEWSDVPGAAVLLAHPENATVAFPKIERELRAKERLGPEDDLPPHVLLKAAGLSAFGRSIKDWRLQLAGKPYEFNKVNFMRMWRRRRFRNFLALKWRDFRVNPQALSADSGKD